MSPDPLDIFYRFMYTPIHTSLGALLLYEASSGLLFHNGAVFGVSSLLSGSVFNPNRDNIAIVAGMACSVVPAYLFASSLIPTYPSAPYCWTSLTLVVMTAFLTGWGTRVNKRHPCVAPLQTLTVRTRTVEDVLLDICYAAFRGYQLVLS